MGLLEKLSQLGLVEHEKVDAKIPAQSVETPVVEATAEINSTENVIEEIYAQNDMSGKEDSIYAVQSFIDTLPPEMTTAKKQSSVYGILKVTGKSVERLIADAKNRIGVLSAASDGVVADKNGVICVAEQDIEDLKRAIEHCEAVIKDAEAVKESVVKAVNDEIAAIEEMVKFCEGMGDNK